MDTGSIINRYGEKLSSAVAHFKEELNKLRTGRAHPGMLDGVKVVAYGAEMPLNQVGSITVPEPQQLQITPFDPNNLQAIATAVRENQSLGLNPMDDGRVVRIQIPPLTEERRRDFVKLLGARVEDSMISMRNARHEAIKETEVAKKDKLITEDDMTSIKKRLDEVLTEHKNEIDKLARAKEQEIMTV